MAAAEQKKSYAVIKNFKGLNTKANRTAIDEEEFSWIENAMPVGYGNIKIVPAQVTLKDAGNSAVSFGNTVTTLTSCNLGLSDYLIGFEANGRGEYYKIDTATVGNVGVTGTFSSANVSTAQYKNEKLFIGDPDKGLFTWDGTDLINVGAVGSIGITNKGSGYTTAPAVTISAPNQSNGVQATATCTITANAVSSITLTEGGTGYTSPPVVTILGGGGANATANAQVLTFTTGALYIQVTNGGSGYNPASPPTVTINGGGGANASGLAIVTGNSVSGVIMTNVGDHYTSVPNVTIAPPPSGANATAIGVPNLNQIVSISTFSNRVWVATGRTVTYSSSVSPTDFVTITQGAGSFTLADSTLHGNIQYLLSANNFLYVFGEDSINVFSDLRITATGSTLFTNTNVSASVGSKLKYGVFPYFRSVLFMNNYGMYALVGSTTSKISDQLDGLFPYIDFTKPVSGGQVLVENILTAAFNFYLKANYPFATGGRYVQAVFFEKKWFITSQGNTLDLVNSAPVSGVINLYGVADTALYRLYADTTASISSEIQTALSPMKDPVRTKQALKFGIEATLTTASTLNITVDSEAGSSPSYSLNNSVNWLNNSGATIPWQNNSMVTIGWLTSNGYALYKSDAQQYGKYLGLTMTSSDPAFTINTIEFEHELRVRF